MALTKASLIDLNANELILDLDADTSITADTDDTIHFKIGGTDRVTIAGSALSPSSSDGSSLGTTALEWSDLFLADGAVINFGDDQDVSLTHVTDTGLLLSSTDQLQFGDSGTYIHQSADGVLDLVSDTEIEINATTIDMNGALEVSGTISSGGVITATGFTIGSAAILESELELLDGLTVGTAIASKVVTTDANIDTTGQRNLTITGELDAATLDISGNADIDGTTNLDVVDIDGATQIDATVTVGVDDTGYDVKFFGATSGAYMLWDESVDDLILAGASRVVVPDGQLVLGSTAVTSTAAELNLIDGGTARGTTAVADADGLLHNDGGTMRMTSAATFKTYFQEGISTAYDDLTTGDAAVNIATSAGSITIDAQGNDTDIILKGTDGGADTTFLTIDGSAAGEATFNAGIVIADAGNIGSASDKDAIAISSGGVVTMNQIPVLSAGLNVSGGTIAGTISTATQNSITTMTGLVSTGALDSGSITSGFGNIDNGASNITSGGLLKLDVDADANDVTGDSATGRLTLGAGEDLNLYHGGTDSYIVNDTGDLVIKNGASDEDILFQGNDGGGAITALTLDMSAAGAAGFNGVVTANAGVVVDNITIDGTEIDLSSGDLTIDVAGDIILDADGGDIKFADAGTVFGTIKNSSSDFKIDIDVQDKDFIVTGNDGGVAVTALTLDMSDEGTAVFQHDIRLQNNNFIGSASSATALQIATNGNIVHKVNDDADSHHFRVRQMGGSFGGNNSMVVAEAGRNGVNTFRYFAGWSNTSNSTDVEFYVRGDGEVYADGSFSENGADYAEYFEWKDGNSSDEDRRGYSVVLDGNQIVKATDGQTPIGVISGKPGVVGDADGDAWKGKYLRDDYGSYIMENFTIKVWTDADGEEHNYQSDAIPDGVTVPDDAVTKTEDADGITFSRKKLNPDWNKDTAYVKREDRKEWDTVGLMGKLRIRKGQPTASNWTKMRDVSEAVEEWLIR